VAVYVEPAALERPGFGIQPRSVAICRRGLGRFDVDVVVLNQAPPLLYHRVLRGGARLLSRCEPDTATRDGQALSRYCDLVPQLRKIETAHRARIAAENSGHEPVRLDAATVRRHLLRGSSAGAPASSRGSRRSTTGARRFGALDWSSAACSSA
jgi:hypothetical protein